MLRRLPLYLCLLLSCFAASVSKAQMGGIYTIDSSASASSGNYKNFANALSDLLNGKRTDGGNVNGPGLKSAVMFKVADGTYYEQLFISPVKGSSPTHTITFTSASGDSSKVTLMDTNSTSAVNNYTIYLNGACFITFRKMTIARGSKGNYTNVIQFDNHAKGNNFSNNRIIGKKFLSFTSPYPSLVYSQGNYPYTNDSGNTFRNNVMKYNCYGFTLYATSYDPEQNTVIDKNIVDSVYNAGIFTEYQKGFRITENTISNVLNSYGLGIYSYYSYGVNQILSNKIYMPNGGEALGLEYNGTLSNDTSLVANNFIFVGGSSFANGIYTYGGDYIKFYYNNVLLNGSSVYASYASSFTSTFLGGSHFELTNNNLVNMQTGTSSYTIYNSNNAIGKSDYNNLYTAGSTIGFYNTSAYSDLSDWISNTSLDSHSISLDPLYISDHDLHATNIFLNKKAVPLKLVSTDIDDKKRDKTQPDIGANEINPIAHDAGITFIDSPAVGCSGKRNIYVHLRNFGTSPITSVNVEWAVDTNKANTLKFSGKLAVNKDTFIKAGNYTFAFPSLNSSSIVKAWTRLPNGNIDSNRANDTSAITIYHGMSGSYSVGGVSPNFINFAQAVTAITNNGVCGAVTFSVRDGIYKEQIEMGPVAGTGSSSRVTFQAQSGDSSKVILSWPASNTYSTNNFTLSLTNASWITFRRISIVRSGLGYYGNTLQFRNGSSNNTFSNNLILGAVIPPADYPFYYSSNTINSSGDNCHFNTFRNNLIKGGSYNCYLGNSSRFPANGNVFTNNTFDSSYWGAIYMQNHSAPSLRFNTVKNVQGNYGFGFELHYVYGGSRITSNRILMMNGGIPLYLGYGTKGAFNSRLQISNNYISLAGVSGAGDAGIEADNADSIDILFNNIIVYDPSAASSAVFINSLFASVSLYNNNLVNAGGGYALYIPSSSLQSSNNNNLFSAKGYLGYYNATNISNIASWKYISSMDTNSISSDPLYYSFSDLHVRNSALDGAAKPISGITLDFDGQKRNTKFPDIGADEFSPLKIDAGISGIDSPKTGFCAGSKNIYVHIRNYGTDTINVLHIKWTINGVNIPVTAFSGALVKGGEISYKLGNFTFSTGTPVNMQVYCYNPNNIKDSQPLNDTTTLTITTGLKGNYTIGTGVKSDYPGFRAATNDIMTRGLCGASTFNVYNGVYNEQVELGSPPGISSKNTLTIKSLSGDSSAVILSSPASSIPNNNYTLLLYGTRYLTMKGLTISRTGTGKFDNVLALTAESSNNIFSNNRFIGTRIPASDAAGYTSSSALVYCLPSANNHNVFDNNYLKGNFWGFYIVGENAYSTASGVILKNNIIDSTYGGIFLEYEDSFIIQKNILRNLKSAYFGIQSYYGGYSSVVSKNRITMPEGGYGLYLFFLHGTSQQYMNISNNIIEMGSSGNGIYASYMDYAGFYYNTVKTSGIISAPVSTFIGYGANTCELYNNIFLNKNPGVALVAGKDIITASGNNDYFTNGKSLINWDGADYPSINSFRKINGLETNTIPLAPTFKDTIKFILADTSGLIHKGKTIKNITDDYYSTARNLKTPDIGAVESDPADTDLAIVSILSPVNGDCGDSFTNVSIKIQNKGLRTISAFSATFICTSTSKTTLNYVFPKGASLAPGNDTIITFSSQLNTSKGGSFGLKAYTSVSGDKHHRNDTIIENITIYPRLSPPVARNGNTCGPGPVKLLASSSDSIFWYDSAGHFLLGGDSLKTSVLSKTRDYFAASVSSAHRCGAESPDSAGGYNPSSDFFKGLQFDATADIVIDSMTIYPEKSGILQLNLRDSTGKIITKKQINVTPNVSFTPMKIFPGFRIPAGKNYSIDALNSSIGSLYANGVNSKGTATFPYKTSGLLSIKDNTDTSGKSGKYYYFYNWYIHEGFSCPGTLKKISAVVGTGTKPIANFGNSVTCNGTAIFFDSSRSTGTPIHSYSYEFGDSSSHTDTGVAAVSHYFSKRGLYRTLLTVKTTGGCTDSIGKWVNIVPSLSAAFSLDNSCFGDSVRFHDATYSLSNPVIYKWDLGDSDSSALSNPVHLYTASGLYRVRLTVVSPLCTDTISHFAHVFPVPRAQFSFKGTCFNDTTVFTNSSLLSDSQSAFTWYFGDVTKLDGFNARHQYKIPGKYAAELKVTSIHNCIGTKDSLITIHTLPDAHFSVEDSSNIFHFTANDSTLNSYNWDFGDTMFSLKGRTTAHAYVYPKKYTVVLKVRDGNNCYDSNDSIINYFANGISLQTANGFYCSVYPNPFRDEFNVTYLQSDFSNTKMELVDMNGRILGMFDAGQQMQGMHSFRISGNTTLSKQGVYILRIYSGNKISVLRIVKI